MKNRIFPVVAAFLFAATVQAQSTVDSIAAKYKLVPMPEALTIEKTFPVLGSYQLAGVDVNNSTSMTNTTIVGGQNSSNSSNTTSSNAAPSAAETTTNSSSTSGMEMANSGSVTVTLDSVNKGVIWVEGLPQGKFKAYLKKSPSTYRILTQKTESGQQIQEGTLVFDQETKMLNIALGKAYDEVDPTAIFALNPALMNDGTITTDASTTDNTVKIKTKTATSKTKAKVTYFTASKIDQTPTTTTTTSEATTSPAPSQEQQPAGQQQPSGQGQPAPAPQQ